MNQSFPKLKTQHVEQDGEYLEVVILLVTHHIDHGVDGIIIETELGGADILRHVDRRAIGAQQQFLIQTIRCKIGPYRTIFFLEEQPLIEATEHLLFSGEVGL